MLDNKNHQWPLIVSAERSRVTSFLSKGPKMKWPCAKTAQADLTRGPGRPTCEKTSCAAESSLVSQVVSARRLQAEKSFFPRACRGKKQIQFYFVLCGGQNSTRFLVCLVGTLFLYPCLGEKKRAVKWPPNKYSIPNAPLSCQSFFVNPHNFSRLPKL